MMSTTSPTISSNHSETSSISSHTSNEKSNNYYKIILLGDSAVGKSNLLLRFTQNTFFTDTKSTIGVEYFSKTVQIQNNKLVKVQIWDTAGQERYQIITKSYYRYSVGAFLVYDVTNRKSFEHIPKWLKEVEAQCDINCRCILVGNKCDLDKDHQRQVSERDGEAFAESNGMAFIETSALNAMNVEGAFHKLIQQIYTVQENLNTQKEDEDEVLRGIVGLRVGSSIQAVTYHHHHDSSKSDMLRSVKFGTSIRNNTTGNVKGQQRSIDFKSSAFYLQDGEANTDSRFQVGLRRCCGLL